MPEVTITADILDRAPGPALSATSDMPVLEPAVAPPPEPVVEPTPEPTEPPASEDGDGEALEADGEIIEVEAEPAPKPRRPGVQQRFSELTTEKKIEVAKREAAEAHAARLEKLLAETLAKPAAEPPPPVVEPPAPDPRPVRETYETPEAYDEALIEWSTKRALAITSAEQEQSAKAQREAEKVAEAARTQEAGFKQIQEAHNARRTAIIETLPDYEQVAERDDLKISLPMGIAIMQNDTGPQAAYYLGQHPEVAERIAAMVLPGQVFPAGNPMAGQPVPDVQRQLIEMGKVFAIVEREAQPPVITTPPPPAPINPLRRGSNPATPKSLEDIGNEGSMEDYAAKRMADLQRRGPGIRVN